MARKKSFTVNIHSELAEWIEGIVIERRAAIVEEGEREGWTEEEIESKFIDAGKGKVAREFLKLAKKQWDYEQLLGELNELDTRTKEEEGTTGPSDATFEAAFGIAGTAPPPAPGATVSGLGSSGGRRMDTPDVDTGEQHA